MSAGFERVAAKGMMKQCPVIFLQIHKHHVCKRMLPMLFNKGVTKGWFLKFICQICGMKLGEVRPYHGVAQSLHKAGRHPWRDAKPSAEPVSSAKRIQQLHKYDHLLNSQPVSRMVPP